MQFKMHKEEYYYVGNGKRARLPDIFHHSISEPRMIWNGDYYARETSSPKGGFVRLFVGTKADYSKEVGRERANSEDPR